MKDQGRQTNYTPLQKLKLEEYDMGIFYRYFALEQLEDKGFGEIRTVASLTREHFVHINPVLRMLVDILVHNDCKLAPEM